MSNVAQTILAQLGGSRFLAMTGAKNLVGGSDMLMFNLPASMTKGRANKMRVKLEASDTYTLTTYRLRDLTMSPVEEVEGVYCDSLRDVFEDMTGLSTRL